MRVVLVYRPKSEHARAVETFAHDFGKRYTGIKLEHVNVDEREGIALASLYDVMQFPTILVMGDDGVIQQVWQGSQLPLIDEVASYIIA